MEKEIHIGNSMDQALSFLCHGLFKFRIGSFHVLFCNMRNVVHQLNSRNRLPRLCAVIYDVKCLLGTNCNVVFSVLPSSSFVGSLSKSRAALGYDKFSFITL